SRLGEQQVAHAFRTRDMLGAGVPLTLGSDWPVASMDPRLGMAWARLRRTPGEHGAPVFEPEQALDGDEALRGYTMWAAAALGRSDRSRITAGALADLSCFAEDPSQVGADELVDLPVVATVVGGRLRRHGQAR